jgi:hypothetical protein
VIWTRLTLLAPVPLGAQFHTGSRGIERYYPLALRRISNKTFFVISPRIVKTAHKLLSAGNYEKAKDQDHKDNDDRYDKSLFIG